MMRRLLAVLGVLVGGAAADEVETLNALLRDLPTVGAERRGDEVAVVGFTADDSERALLGRVLSQHKDAVDLTTSDIGDPNRMIEIDVIIVQVNDRVSSSAGFDFLSLVNLRYDLFALDHKRALSGFLTPTTTGVVTDQTQAGHLFRASVDYDVRIANATDTQVSVLARPHLTALNGKKAEFQAGGEIVFQVTGIQSGDIKPYPFGIQLLLTPTLLRSRTDDGRERILLDVEAIRTSVLGLVLVSDQSGGDVIFDKTRVASKAVIPMNETLILSGLYQREHRAVLGGVPYLRRVPGLDMVFANDSVADDVQSVIIFISAREAGWINEARNREIDALIERRRAYTRARLGEIDSDAFKAEYPDWYRHLPNRYATQFFMLGNSSIYRQISGDDLRHEALEAGLWVTDTAREAAGQE